MQDVVLSHECDRKANSSPLPTNVPLTNCQIYLDISLQQKLKSFKTSSIVCSLDKCPLLNLMLKLPLALVDFKPVSEEKIL